MLVPLLYVQDSAKKMTQHLKCDYSVTPEIFLCQILHACLVEFCPLMCRFCLKLLCIYKIGIMANFKLEFCNYTLLFVMSCYVEDVRC